MISMVPSKIDELSYRRSGPAALPKYLTGRPGKTDSAGEQKNHSFPTPKAEGFRYLVKKSAMILFATFTAWAD
jgi:hypothetical protein